MQKSIVKYFIVGLEFDSLNLLLSPLYSLHPSSSYHSVYTFF